MSARALETLLRVRLHERKRAIHRVAIALREEDRARRRYDALASALSASVRTPSTPGLVAGREFGRADEARTRLRRAVTATAHAALSARRAVRDAQAGFDACDRAGEITARRLGKLERTARRRRRNREEDESRGF